MFRGWEPTIPEAVGMGSGVRPRARAGTVGLCHTDRPGKQYPESIASCFV